ncbi:MAG: capsid assembly protein [Alphaproteobacteria bacterium]
MEINLLTEGLDINAVPEKFKDAQSGAVNIPAILNSYTELERKMSSQPSAPKSPEEYCIKCEHGLFEPDEEVNKRLHAKGLSEEQMQEVYDLAAEKLIPLITELAGDFQAEREVEKLIEHFGGQESWKEVSRQLLAFGQKNLPADVLESLSTSYEGVMALYGMMKQDGPSLMKEESKPDNATDMNEIKSMMRDPKYWKEKDPAFVAKVTENFKKLYS